MPRFRIKVSDTVTYERDTIVEIDAVDATMARDLAYKAAVNGQYDRWLEDNRTHISSTPVQATVMS
jgi:hypothetical protein